MSDIAYILFFSIWSLKAFSKITWSLGFQKQSIFCLENLCNRYTCLYVCRVSSREVSKGVAGIYLCYKHMTRCFMDLIILYYRMRFDTGFSNKFQLITTITSHTQLHIFIWVFRSVYSNSTIQIENHLQFFKFVVLKLAFYSREHDTEHSVHFPWCGVGLS